MFGEHNHSCTCSDGVLHTFFGNRQRSGLLFLEIIRMYLGGCHSIMASSQAALLHCILHTHLEPLKTFCTSLYYLGFYLFLTCLPFSFPFLHNSSHTGSGLHTIAVQVCWCLYFADPLNQSPTMPDRTAGHGGWRLHPPPAAPNKNLPRQC